MRDMIKTTVSLFIICVVVTFCLAFVNSITKDTIAQRNIEEAEEQRRQVFAAADGFKLLEDWEDKDESGLIREAYGAYSGETLLGYVFAAYPVGYGGEISVTVGVTADNKISGVKVGDNEETAGLGSKTANDKFTVQYKDKDILQDFTVVTKPASTDHEIEAVSGATISSTAVTKAVTASARLGSLLLQEQDGGEIK